MVRAAVLAMLFGGLAAGCGHSVARMRDTAMTRIGEWSYGGWLSSYQTAEDRCRETGQPLLILYKRPGAADEGYRDALPSHSKDAGGAPFVRCVLSSGCEPDRRFVSQFGVERAPGVVVRHSDGTFHTKYGRFTADEATAFVGSAVAPGAAPLVNPFVARRSQYAWFTSLRDAGLQAANTQQPLLIAYERRLSRDASQLEALLETTEVHRRVADMVPCRLTVWDAWSDPYDGPFGVLHLPAIILVWPDGQSDILQRPVSTDPIVRFVEDARSRFAERTPSGVDAPSGTGSPTLAAP